MPKPWLRPRGYLHLTPHLNVTGRHATIKAYLTNKEKIARHNFSPLIYKTIRERRYKKTGLSEDPQRAHSWLNDKGKVVTSAKDRPIHYPTHLDGAIYGYYAVEVLGVLYEDVLKTNKKLSDCVTAYRRESGKSNIHHAAEAFNQIKQRGTCVAIAMDIKGFFSSLDHRILKKAWANLLGLRSLPPDHFNVFKSVTKFSYADLKSFRQAHGGFDEYQLRQNYRRGSKGLFATRDDLYQAIKEGRLRVKKNQWRGPKDDSVWSHNAKKQIRRPIGIPQGLALSSVLANLYMLPFDRKLLAEVENVGGVYRRYSDDLVIICEQEHMSHLISIAQEKIEDLKLKISTEKTEICTFRKIEGSKFLTAQTLAHTAPYEMTNFQGKFTYLGFSFDGRKVLIKDKNISRFYRRMKQAVRKRVKQADMDRRVQLDDRLVVHKRRLTKRFCARGKMALKVNRKTSRLVFDRATGEHYFKNELQPRRQHGNFHSYVKRASRIMKEPAILRQLRNSGKILEQSIQKELVKFRR